MISDKTERMKEREDTMSDRSIFTQMLDNNLHTGDEREVWEEKLNEDINSVAQLPNNFSVGPKYTLEGLLSQEIKYAHNEPALLDEIRNYINSTYNQHYAGDDKTQAVTYIIESGHGIGFTLGDIIKYADRYGKKGDSPEEWRKDLMKIVHYSILALYTHDRTHGVDNNS